MEPIRIDFLNAMKTIFRKPLTIHHLTAVLVLLAARHNVIDNLLHYIMMGINLLPHKLLVWPIRLALFFYPIAPKFHLRALDCFFLVTFFFVELLSGSLVATHIFIYCNRKPEYCFDIHDDVSPTEFDEIFLDFCIQLFITVYFCCLTSILKSIKKEIGIAFRISNSWFEKNIVALCALSNILMVVVEFNCTDGALKALLIYMICKVIHDIWFPSPLNEVIMIIGPNRSLVNTNYPERSNTGFVFRDALEPDEQPQEPDEEPDAQPEAEQAEEDDEESDAQPDEANDEEPDTNSDEEQNEEDDEEPDAKPDGEQDEVKDEEPEAHSDDESDEETDEEAAEPTEEATNDPDENEDEDEESSDSDESTDESEENDEQTNKCQIM